MTKTTGATKKAKTVKVKKESKIRNDAKVKKELRDEAEAFAAGEETSLVKPGQRYPTPTPGFGDRVFYESLLKQRPDSFMAQEWCIAYGVLPMEDAEKLYPQVLAQKKKGKISSVVSPVKSKRANSAKVNTKKKSSSKRRRNDAGDEGVDVGLQVPGGDGIGISTM